MTIDTMPVDTKAGLTSTQVLRSVNIVFDANSPERIVHFFPTTKSVDLLKRFLDPEENSAKLVVAPYGSGKSLVASFFQHLIENRSNVIETLTPVINRLKSLDQNLFRKIQERIGQDQIIRRQGLVITFVGYIEDLPKSFKSELLESLDRIGEDLADVRAEVERFECKSLDQIIELLSMIRDRFGGDRIDHICILWDEFGRHLEQIVLQGEAPRLNELQLIAEFAARTKKIMTSLVPFLHQSLMRYASNIPQSVIQEWKKVEGRFKDIQFVDDSKEVLVLASRVIDSRFPDAVPTDEQLGFQLENLRDVGLYAEFSDDELAEIIRNAWPVLPAALYILPRISSRVAQNERTLFSFLFNLSDERVTTPADVYDYFSDLMRADSSFGGTYHHWLETQSGLTKVDSAIDERIIKTLCLYGLGLSGERTRVSRRLLAIASSSGERVNDVQVAVDALIGRKLLLYRKNADTVLLWHATDVDLRGKLESEKVRLFHSFDLLSYLNDFLPPEDWRPVEYNSNTRMLRYFRGVYVSIPDLESRSFLDEQGSIERRRGDGLIAYILPETDDDITRAIEVSKTVIGDKRIIVLVPRSAKTLLDTAIEAVAINRLLHDGSLAAEDPLVVPELQQMLDDSQGYLTRVLDRMYSPSVQGPRVFCDGKEIHVQSRREFRSFLSIQIGSVYSMTPVINNELINKMNPSQVVRNARKKLVLGILDRYGTPDLGVQKTRPDGSIFRTVLVNSGLYVQDGDTERYRFRRPHELQDPAWILMWREFEAFFTPTDANNQERNFSELFERLQTPPIGIRTGVIPVLLAAAFRAFPTAMSIINKAGEYVRDIKPSTIEDICAKPDDYRVTVVTLEKGVRDYLEAIETLFRQPDSDGYIETDPLRRCFDEIESWKSRLPSAALVSKKLSRPAMVFQKLIVNSKDPAKLLLTSIFSQYGKTFEDWPEMVGHISNWKVELESVVNQYFETASRTVLSALEMVGGHSVRDAAHAWIEMLPSAVTKTGQTGVSAALVQRLSMRYDNDERLLDSVSSLLLGGKVEKWDDSSVVQFEREFRNAVRQIEDAVVTNLDRASDSTEAAADLITARIQSLLRKLQNVVGREKALKLIAEMTNEEIPNGNYE